MGSKVKGDRMIAGNINGVTAGETAFMVSLAAGLFSVDGDGRIWRHATTAAGNMRQLKRPRRAERHVSGGYLQVVITLRGRRFCAQAHRLVWLTAGRDIPDGMEVDHKNNQKADNRLDNLEAVTPKINSQRAYETGVKRPPVRPINGLARGSVCLARRIRELYKSGSVSQQELGMRFGFSQRSISRIVRGEAWPDERLKTTE